MTRYRRMVAMRRTTWFCLLFLAAACSAKKPASSPTPTPTATATATTAPSPTPKVDAHAVNVSTLIRPGTKANQTLYADIDGDGTDEIAVFTQSTAPPPQGMVVAQSYVDVFAYAGGSWRKVYDATAASSGPVIQDE